jgi:hypothetical protein
MLTKRLENALGRFVRVDVAIVFLVFFLFYAITHTRNLSAAHDWISYINKIDNGIWFDQHHLLYGWFAANWVGLWRLLGYAGDSVVLVELLSAVFGALTLSVFYLLLRTRLHMSRLGAVLGTMLPAFSFGFWFYSPSIDVYVISLFFLVVALYLMTAETINEKTMFLVGILQGVAILFHQMHVLFFAVVVGVLFLRRREPMLPLWRAFSYYLLALAPTVAVPYAIVILGVHKLYSIPGIWRWVTAHKARFWNELGLSMFVKAAVAFGRSLIGGHFIFALSRLRGILGTILQGRGVLEEQFLVRNMSDGLASLLIGASVVLGSILVVGTLVRLRNWRRLWQQQTVLMGAAITWFAVYAGFFFFGGPMNVEFWIPQSLIWWLLFLALWSEPGDKEERLRPKLLGMLAVVSLLLLGINSFGSIQWLMDQGNDYYYARTRILVENTEPADLIIIDHVWRMGYYLERYADTGVLTLSSAYSQEQDLTRAVESVQRSIEGTLSAGGRVLVLPEAVHLQPERRSLFDHDISTFMTQLWSGYQDSWSEIETGSFAFYLLDGG